MNKGGGEGMGGNSYKGVEIYRFWLNGIYGNYGRGSGAAVWRKIWLVNKVKE